MAAINKIKNKVKGHNYQKAHLHPLRDACVEYEKQSDKRSPRLSRGNRTRTRTHGRTVKHATDNIPRSIL